MAAISVYEFEVHDPVRHRWEVSESMGTLDAIERRGGVPIRRSVMAVDDSLIDAEGMLVNPVRIVVRSAQSGRGD